MAADKSSSSNNNRQSVDWYAGLAADASSPVVERLPSTMEEEEPEAPPAANIPEIQVTPDLMADIDKSTCGF